MDIHHTHQLLDRTVDLVKTYLEQVQTGQRKVVNFQQPDDLRTAFDFTIDQEGVSDDEIFQSLQKVLDYSVANQHPRFFNALRAGADMYGVIAEWLIATMGVTMYTYEMAPVFTLMEEYIFDKIANKVGWDMHTGFMQPGGSTSNLLAMHLARYHVDASIHTSGLFGQQQLVIFTSDEAHYSITKGAMLLGLGKDAVIKVKTDDLGHMLIDDLEIQIQAALTQGKKPMMINATSGTTVLGAYDDLDRIADVANTHNIWLHVDAARGGTVMFDDVLSTKMKGIDRVDSFTRNPHKMMGVPLQCSILMTRHTSDIDGCNRLKSKYLFGSEKAYDACYDTGDTYTQCGRKVDVLKLRLMWKAHGDGGIAARTTKAFDDAAYLAQKIEQSDRLLLVQDPECTNVCFWYIPTTMDISLCTREFLRQEDVFQDIHELNTKIQSLMINRGEMMCMVTNTKTLPNFFRMITISPEVRHEDLDFVVDHIQELGKEIESGID